jgi:hypothetical protein
MKLKKTCRLKLLKKTSYYTELYEWWINKLYAHSIRQIENGLATWSQDLSGVETPLLIKYAKKQIRPENHFMLMMTRRLQNRMILFFIVPIVREGGVLKTLLTKL